MRLPLLRHSARPIPRANCAQRQAEFRGDVKASLRLAAKVHGIGDVPGAADLGDFDATSTTIAFAPGGEEDVVPGDLLRETFEHDWRIFTDRRDGLIAWSDYTPYELRLSRHLRAARLARAGARAARILLQGPVPSRLEPVGRGGREGSKESRFIGDMPYAWVASDHIRSVLDMFVYERQTDGAQFSRKAYPTIGSSPPAFPKEPAHALWPQSISPSDPKEPTSSLKSPATRTRPAASFCLSLGRALPMSTARPPRRPFEMASCTLSISRSRSASCEQTRANHAGAPASAMGPRRQHFKKRPLACGPRSHVMGQNLEFPFDFEV